MKRYLHVNNLDTYSELIGKHLAGETSPAEEQALFAWLAAEEANKKFFEEMEQVWKWAGDAPYTPIKYNAEAAWSKIGQALDGHQEVDQQESMPESGKTSTRIVPLSKIKWGWSIAAAILLALAAGIWWFADRPAPPRLVEAATGSQEKKEVVLPDGSRVWLNENTRIAYQEDFTQRKISLEGEAFFDVVRMEQSPFEISSGNARTTVLGTSFNVRAYPAENLVEVTVKTGKVALAVTNQPARHVVIPAGASGVFDKKSAKVEVENAKIANADAWKTQKLEFDNALVEEVLQSLERYFDTDIAVSNDLIKECHYSAVFEKPQIEEAIKVIAFGLNLQVEKTDSGYLLKGEGCQPEN